MLQRFAQLRNILIPTMPRHEVLDERKWRASWKKALIVDIGAHISCQESSVLRVSAAGWDWLHKTLLQHPQTKFGIVNLPPSSWKFVQEVFDEYVPHIPDACDQLVVKLLETILVQGDRAYESIVIRDGIATVLTQPNARPKVVALMSNYLEYRRALDTNYLLPLNVPLFRDLYFAVEHYDEVKKTIQKEAYHDALWIQYGSVLGNTADWKTSDGLDRWIHDSLQLPSDTIRNAIDTMSGSIVNECLYQHPLQKERLNTRDISNSSTYAFGATRPTIRVNLDRVFYPWSTMNAPEHHQLALGMMLYNLRPYLSESYTTLFCHETAFKNLGPAGQAVFALLDSEYERQNPEISMLMDLHGLPHATAIPSGYGHDYIINAMTTLEYYAQPMTMHALPPNTVTFSESNIHA